MHTTKEITMKYTNFDTGEIWSKEEIKEAFDQQNTDENETFEDYFEAMLSLGRARRGGFVEID